MRERGIEAVFSSCDLKEKSDLCWSMSQTSHGRWQLHAMTQNCCSWEAGIFKMNWKEEFLHCVFWVSPSCSKMPAANFCPSPSNPLKPCVRSTGPDSCLWIPPCNVAAEFCNFCMILQKFLQTFLPACCLCMHLKTYTGFCFNYL